MRSPRSSSREPSGLVGCGEEATPIGPCAIYLLAFDEDGEEDDVSLPSSVLAMHLLPFLHSAISLDASLCNGITAIASSRRHGTQIGLIYHLLALNPS